VIVFTHRLRVRYHECDAQGVVFNANHFAYFDVALTELWRDRFGSYRALVDSGVDVVVRDAQASFHAPARFDDEIALELTVARLGTTSMVLAINERRGDTLLVDGRMTYVFVDPAAGTKLEIPARVRAMLSEEPSEARRPA
jgi:acyl-CoA thioester hydrolase